MEIALRKKLFILGLVVFFNTHATGIASTDLIQGWVPKGWKLIQSAVGDLNQDGKSDAVMVLERDDPKNFKQNDGLGAPALNLNPRRLVILLKTTSGYNKVADLEHFLPSENSADNSCLSDPLEEGGVGIHRGLLQIDLHYWLSCGSWGVSHDKFVFRYENERFRLIGLDSSEFMRNSGESTEYSTNFLTGRKKITTGLNMFETTKAKTSWKKIPGSRAFYLDEISSECNTEKKNQDWCK